VKAFEQAGARVEEVRLGLRHSQHELSALWVRMGGAIYTGLLEGFRQQGIDLLGEHREEMTPQFVELAESARGMSVLHYKRDEILRSQVFDAVQDAFDRYDLL